MKTHKRFAIPVVMLIAAAGQPTSAQEVDTQSLISPNEQSVEFGVIGALGSTRTTGKFTGLSDYDALPIANGTFIKRDEASGTWYRVTGVDLGLEDRGVRLDYERQGDWKLFIDLNQIHRSEPVKINTGLSGIDSNTQLVNGTAMREIDLETDRYNGTFGLSKRFSKEFEFRVSARSEYKEGGRIFGASRRFLVDPIDQFTHEVDARVNYTGKRLQLTGGFLGSIFVNAHQAVYNNINNYEVIALPPDNEAYNFYLNGGYKFTPDTRGNFKLSYTLMNQTDTFYTSTRAGVNRSDLGGEVHNYLGMGSINSRVTDDLSLRAKVRYEGRHDSTPVLEYNSPAADRTGKNNHMNRDTVVAEGEANYRLPKDYRLIGGIKYEYWDREYLPLRQASWRERTEDYSGRVQLNKQLTETLGGSLAYIYSERDGSAFLISHDNNPGDIDPIHWGDRERHQWRLSMDWAATDKLSFHALVDGSLDTYHSEERWLGPEEGGTHNASIDASYQLNPDWSLTGFVSLNEITREQITVDKRTPTANGVWTADLRNIGYAGGVGIQGMPKTGFKLGADLQYTYDKQEYELSGPTHPTLTDLPDIDYHQFDLKLSADYSVSKNGSVKLGYNLTYLKNNDWIYDLDVSSEGSLYELPDNGFSHFIGASYRYQW